MAIHKLFILLMLLFCISCASNKGAPELTVEEKKAQLFYDHGTAYLVNKKYTEALDYLLKANKSNPNRSDVHNNLGMAYYFKERPKQAIRHLKRALDIDPKNDDARNNLASLYFNLKKYNAAQKEYLHILNNLVYKKQFRVYYNLALLAEKRGQNKQAKQYLYKSLKEKSD